MNCVIVEDEIAGQEIIKIKLKKYFPTVKILKILGDKNEAISFFKENHEPIHFIFLDIEIKGGTGIEVIESIQKRDFDVIFTTAYQEFAVEAFRLEATHYLLKPINDTEFQEAINRVLARKVKISDQQGDSISITYKNEIVRVKTNDILFCKSDGSYTEIFLDDMKYLSSKSIGEFEKLLDKKSFFRVHHSYVVNKTKIDKISKGRSGNIILKGFWVVPISQRKMNEFMEFLNA